MNHWIEWTILTIGIVAATVFVVWKLVRQLFYDRGSCRACSDSCMCEQAVEVGPEEIEEPVATRS